MYSNLAKQCESPGQGMLGTIPSPTTRQRLIQARDYLSKQLADVDAAIKALDANPGAEELLNALGKVNY